MYLKYLNPRACLACTYEYKQATPLVTLAIIAVLCADRHRYLSRMCGGPTGHYTLHYALHD